MIAPNRDHHQFNAEYFGTLDDLRKAAQSGSFRILMVACSDHYMAPDTVSFAGPNPFYVLQEMAACIPSSGQKAHTSILAGIEYALGVMNIEHAIVCQHLGCQIIPHWMSNPNDAPSAEYSSFEDDVRIVVDEVHAEATGADRISLMIRKHLVAQLRNLQSHEIVQSRLRDGRLRIHGWLADDQTARVESFDPTHGQFIPIEIQ